jgi:hypothetical protein
VHGTVSDQVTNAPGPSWPYPYGTTATGPGCRAGGNSLRARRGAVPYGSCAANERAQCRPAAHPGVRPPVQQHGKPGSMTQESPSMKTWTGSLNRLSRTRDEPRCRGAVCHGRGGGAWSLASPTAPRRRQVTAPEHVFDVTRVSSLGFPKRCSPLRTTLSNNGTDGGVAVMVVYKMAACCCFLVACPRRGSPRSERPPNALGPSLGASSGM